MLTATGGALRGSTALLRLPNQALPVILLGLLMPAVALAQAPTQGQPPAPQLSPKAAYEQAMHPLEVTRHAISNWSDTEVGALTVAMAQAKSSCDLRDPKAFSGDDLIELARLCSLGQNWAATIEASQRYIAAEGPKPELGQAYAGMIEALLHRKIEPAAFAAAQTMLSAVPYDTLTAETLDETIDWMRFVHTDDALTLAKAREPLLLGRLRVAAAVHTAPDPGAVPLQAVQPLQSLHEMYSEGLDLAALQQLSRVPEAEIAATVAGLDSALPATLTPDEAIPIATARRRYGLLGQRLPDLTRPLHPADGTHPVALTSLDLLPLLPQLPAVNAITGLLLFPDWCAQCLRMAARVPQTVFTVAGHEAYLHNLLAETTAPNPERKTPGSENTPLTPADAANLLRGTPTLVVDPSFLDQFAVTDVPFLILTDYRGIVRVLQPVSDEALQPGGTIDAAIARVGGEWPDPRLVPKPAAASQAAHSGPSKP
jgi:hypothetical protein